MSPREIVGVVLVRNEDLHLRAALDAAAAFCDRFLLFDHGSSDRSAAILQSFAASHPNAVVRSISHPSESHDALRPLCGSSSWIFGVDGDEVYDAAGLGMLKPRLLAGEFDRHWMVMGHCLHTECLEDGMAAGFAAPPSRSITKLFNFSAISSWTGRSMERLHGGQPEFLPGFSAGSKRLLFEEAGWEKSQLRCLHLCFCPRSSLDAAGAGSRANIDEIYNSRVPSFLARIARCILPRPSGWKRERYRRGGVVTVPTAPFFSC